MRVEALADAIAFIPGTRELAQPVLEDLAFDLAGLGPRLAKDTAIGLDHRLGRRNADRGPGRDAGQQRQAEPPGRGHRGSGRGLLQ